MEALAANITAYEGNSALAALVANITAYERKHATASEGDAAWALTSTVLVLLMTPGLAFFYGGLVRETSIVNTMMMSLISMGITGVIWFFVGFSLAFGGKGAFIGNLDYALMAGLDDHLWPGSTIWSFTFAMFQMTFAIISAAIMSGSLVERVNFWAYCVLISLWCVLVYVPICHWVWGAGGWLDELGVKDFAGGTVVHVSSGISGLVAAAMLGPRRQQRKGGTRPNNVPFVLLGAALLWFGWNGFNAGSALAADDVAARAATTTNLAASSSMIVWVMIETARMRQPSSVGAMVGAVAGLVVITPAAGFVSPLGAVCMGAIGSPICYFAVEALNKFERVDDSLDAFGLHGVGGCVGAILTGVFAEDGGLFHGGGINLLLKQCLGAGTGLAYSALVTAALFSLIKRVMRVRVHQRAEEHGVDKHVHGEEAYGGKQPPSARDSFSTLRDSFNLDEDGWDSEEDPSGASDENGGSAA